MRVVAYAAAALLLLGLSAATLVTSEEAIPSDATLAHVEGAAAPGVVLEQQEAAIQLADAIASKVNSTKRPSVAKQRALAKKAIDKAIEKAIAKLERRQKGYEAKAAAMGRKLKQQVNTGLFVRACAIDAYNVYIDTIMPRVFVDEQYGINGKPLCYQNQVKMEDPDVSPGAIITMIFGWISNILSVATFSTSPMGIISFGVEMGQKIADDVNGNGGFFGTPLKVITPSVNFACDCTAACQLLFLNSAAGGITADNFIKFAQCAALRSPLITQGNQASLAKGIGEHWMAAPWWFQMIKDNVNRWHVRPDQVIKQFYKDLILNMNPWTIQKEVLMQPSFASCLAMHESLPV